MTPSGNPRYILILALSAGVILVGGWLLRPREIPQRPEPPPTATELERLARRAERRDLESASEFFATIARDVSPSMTPVGAAGVTAIAWSEDRLVTAPPRAAHDGERVTMAAASGPVSGRLESQGPDSPLWTIAIDATARGPAPARRAVTPPPPGSWVTAVWRTSSDPAFAMGQFGQTAPATCGITAVREIVTSVPLTEPMLGGGLFDMEGGWLAAILPCGRRLAAIDLPSLDRLIRSADTLDRRLLKTFGFAGGPLTADEQQYFRVTAGVIVREVWNGHAADVSGLWPGDIITAANGHDVAGVEDLLATAAAPDARVLLTVRRRAARMTIAIRDGAAAPAGGAGVMLADSRPDSYPIEAVRAASPAALAGVMPGDRIVRIDQREPRSLAEVNRLMAASRRSWWLEVERETRRIGMLVREEPAP